MTEVIHAGTTRHADWGGQRRYIRIVIHDTIGDLQRAANRYRPASDGYRNAAGCFHPAPDRERYVNGEWVLVTHPNWAGVLRLARGHIATEVVVHEMVHAASAIYRMDVAVRINLGNGCGPREETLAYIIGDITTQAVNVLHDAGAFED